MTTFAADTEATTRLTSVDGTEIVRLSKAGRSYGITTADLTEGLIGPEGPTGPTGPAASPAGSDKQLAYNDGGYFGAISGITWDKSTGILALTTAKLDLARSIGPTSTPGAVWKEATRFLHDFKYGYNGTVTPDGNNLFLGLEAGNFTTGSTATLASQASYNVGIGNEALKAVTTGFDNAAFGYRALWSLTTGGGNVAIGRVALAALTTGGGNVAIGLRAAQTLTSGASNVAIGQDALPAGTSAYENFALGGNALFSVTTGSSNIAIGINAARSLTGAANNIAIGGAALRNATSSQNVAIGGTALFSLTSGDGHVAVGFEAGYYTTGSGNTAIGYRSAKGATGQTARWTTAVGYQTGLALTSAEGSTLMGYNAGASLTTGSHNTLLGTTAGFALTTAQQNVAIGSQALATSSTASFNIAIGNYALTALTSGAGNTAVGYEAGRTLTSGAENALFGNQAGWHLASGSYNTQLGERCGDYNYSGNWNCLVGGNASYLRSTGDGNTIVGGEAARGLEQVLTVTGASGTGSVVTFTFAAQPKAIEAGTTIIVENVTPGAYNGYYTVTGGTTTSCTVSSTTTASFVSGGTLTVTHDITGSCILGYRAMYNPDTGADYNHIVGYQAGYAITTGDRNLLIGYQAGYTLATGARNLLVGYDVDVPASSTSNYGSIGNLLFFSGGFGTGTSVGAGNVGVKTRSPAGTFDIGGNVVLDRDADDILAIRRSTNAQQLRVYNTYTSSTSHEFVRVGFASNVAIVGTVKGSGGGTARALAFQTDGTSRWNIHATAGTLQCESDGGYDIGNDGSLRPNNVWVKSNIVADTAIRVAAGGVLGFRGRTIMTSASDGIMSLRNAADSAYGELNLKTFHAFPGIGATWTPGTNGELVAEATSNTQLTFKLKGGDGTVRSVTLTLA